jgi:hypothetical protein
VSMTEDGPADVLQAGQDLSATWKIVARGLVSTAVRVWMMEDGPADVLQAGQDLSAAMSIRACPVLVSTAELAGQREMASSASARPNGSDRSAAQETAYYCRASTAGRV